MILFVAFIASSTFGVYLDVVDQRKLDTLDRVQARAERLNNHCSFIRLSLNDLRKNLKQSDEKHQRYANGAFGNIEMNDWREVSLCVPENISVRDGCSDNDVPCMLHAVDWALVNVR